MTSSATRPTAPSASFPTLNVADASSSRAGPPSARLKRQDDPCPACAQPVNKTPSRSADKKRITKARLWETYWQLNTIKASLFKFKVEISKPRWERRLAKFFRHCGAQNPTDSLLTPDVVYMAVMPNSRKSYIRQSSRGLFTRGSSHVRQAANPE